MEHIKYHPLVDADTDGTVKTPMFCTTDLDAVTEHHRLYLEEIIPRRFRLCASQPTKAEAVADLDIRCPYCGATLKMISAPTDGLRLTLLTCDRCSDMPQGV